MLQDKIKYISYVEKFISDFEHQTLRNRKLASSLIKREIKKKATKMKVTGNLAKGVYKYDSVEFSHVGLRAPAYHNYLVEFGHIDKKTGKRVPPHPIVYPTFDEQANAVEELLSREIV